MLQVQRETISRGSAESYTAGDPASPLTSACVQRDAHTYITHTHTRAYTYTPMHGSCVHTCIHIRVYTCMQHIHSQNKNYVGLGVVAQWLNLSSVHSA